MHRNAIRLLFLTTAFFLLSNILNANAAEIPQHSSVIFSSSIDSLQNTGKRIAVRDSLLPNDSSEVIIADTISKNDTVHLDENDEIKDIITYKAEDSIVYDMDSKMMYLYNAADVNYQKIKLNADLVNFDWTSYNLKADGVPDSTGGLQGKPVFSDDGKEYKARSIKYNFKTKKGIVFEVTTKEGESYIHSEQVKKNEYDEWFGKSSKYTTCDLDHPHFYFKSKKVKIIPSKVMVTGPANLWVGDVPTPLFVPFAIFPVKQGRKSGIIMPEYGQDAVLGFFLRNGGYYWAVNDYLGLKFTGQVGTNGTFGLGTAAQYALRYKFNGNLSFNYVRTQPFDPDMPGVKPTNSYSVNWQHTQDAKSIPNSSFSANVQMQSADYYSATRVTDQRLLSTTFNSSVNFSHTFPKSPFSIAVSLRHTQNLLQRTIGFTLPAVHIGMSRITPFKSKVATGKPKWYENIGLTYGFDFMTVLNTYDSILFQYQTLNKFRYGINQVASIDAPLTLFKYLNVNPSFSYQERTYFKGVNKYWSPDTVYVLGSGDTLHPVYGRVISDTVYRFNSTRNFNASISLSTKMIGIFKFRKGYVKAIKHVFTPSISGSYHPDFSKQMWGFYRTVQGDASGTPLRYSIFEPDAVYGVPGGGQEGSLNFALNNNFEMKVRGKKDTVDRKVGLLDQVGLTGGYNFAADSLRLLPFNLTVVSSRIFNLINLNFSAQFDPYAVDSFNRKINTFEWVKNRRLLRFASSNISASASLHSKPKPNSSVMNAPAGVMTDYVSYNPNQFYDFDIPWSLSLRYNFNLTRGTSFNPDTVITVQSISASADFNLTPHWKVAVNSGFDITRKQVTLTNISVIRDLHCWELTFTYTPPTPSYKLQQFTILLHPKSGTLKDLKLQRKNSLQQDL